MTSGTLLFVTQVAPYGDGPAGVHGVLDQAAVGVGQCAELAGLDPQHVTDVRTLGHNALEEATVLALFTIGETPWSDAQRATISRRVRSGSLGVAAIHSATDACYGWPDYGQLVGARFDGHPWTQTVDVDVVVPDHPGTAHLGATWTWHDEVYQFRDLRADAQVLLRVPPAQLDLDAPGAKMPPFGFPLSWCFREGEGRVFSTSLGHFPAAWESPAFLCHVAGGVRWVLDSP
ncbi:MAG TPA: ThuA domain-containing protein [Acidimicrobiia bacterium]|nr:ThuA domain-containing protein [Acidimicrobiia bacterium]